MTEDAPEIWDRLPTETGAAWEAFQLYRDAKPSERSLDIMCGESAVRLRALRRWSGIHKWKDRALAFDRRMDAIVLVETKDSRVLASEKRIAISNTILDVAQAQLTEWQTDIDEGRPVNLTPAEVAKLVEIGTKISRLEHGESTENVSIHGRITDMSEEQLVARAQKILEGMLKRE
jgi:hypothetical protein